MQHLASSLEEWTGLILAIVIFGLWLISFSLFLSIPVLTAPWLCLFFGVCLRAYLQTGLFIVAHDAMHRNLLPQHPQINDLIGYLAVTFYAFLPYNHCRKNHHNHHRYTSQVDDPDFCGEFTNPLLWYCKFIGEYFPRRSLINFLLWSLCSIACLVFLFKVDPINLLLFWLLPLVLSSLQLFSFGTYLPHRQVPNNPNFLPRLKRDRYSLVWSLVSCYNFGHYHWEHHQYPQLPWYKLPSASGGLPTCCD